MEWKKIKIGDKKYFHLETGSTPRTSEKIFWNGNIVWVTPKDLGKNKKKTISQSERMITEDGLAGSSTSLVPKGSIVISTRAPIGYVAIADVELCFNQGCKAIVLKDSFLDSNFLYYATLTIVGEMQKLGKGATFAEISKTKLESIELLVPFKDGKPDLAEQKRIASILDKVFLIREKSLLDIQRTNVLLAVICRDWFEGKQLDSQRKKISDVCDIAKGNSPTMKTSSGQYTFVVTSKQRKSANTFQFDDEAVCIPLVSSTGHGKASLHRIHYEKGKFALASIMVALLSKDKNIVLPKYLYYYLSFYKDKLLVPLMRGVANVTIPMNTIGNVLIDVPSKEYQERLVNTLEAVDELGKKFIDRNLLMEQFIQSNLNYAFQVEAK